jgi:hypothetical protein
MSSVFRNNNSLSKESLVQFINDESYKTISRQILVLLDYCPEGLSRNELSQLTGRKICSIIKPAFDLIHNNEIVKNGTKYDESTKRNVEVLTRPNSRIKKKEPQFELELLP